MGLDYFKIVYLAARGLEGVTLSGVLGMAANFVHLTNVAHHQPPSILMAVLVSSIMAFFWLIVSVTQYDDTHIPFLATAAVDAAFLVVFAVFAIVLGQPMSLALSSCASLPGGSGNNTLTALPVVGANNTALFNATAVNVTSPNDFLQLANIDPQTACLELNAVWGLLIALAISFFFSSTFAGLLWIGKRRRGGAGGADVEENKWASASGSAAGSERGSFDH